MNILEKLWITHRLRRRFYDWDTATLHRHQAARVRRILAYARAHSPYYRRVLPPGGDLASAPKMDKAEMMECFDEINTAGLDRDELVQFRIEQEREGKPGLYRGAFSVGLSSGTSGSRGLTVLGKAERQRYGCLIWARNGLPRHVRTYRVLFAIRTNNPTYMEPRSFGAKLVYVDYSHPPEELARLVEDKELNIIAGPPSLLSLIGRHRQLITHPIDALISYAEVLDDKTRAALEETFGAPVVQIYQGAEGFIGSTCTHGKLHINEDTVLVEQEAVGGAGAAAVQAVVVTDLYRTTQPIIRYALNDVLEIDPEPCACGSCFRLIKTIHGRADDIFLLRGAGGETRYLFPDYVRRSINQASADILEYQALQHAVDEIEIRLVLAPGADRGAIETAIRENLLWRAEAAKGQLGRVFFSDQPPKPNPRSHKLIRVVRAF
jgi:putative adenylate-forming enzyme